MDGLSSAASVLAVVSLSLQLAEGFAKLYKFWVSIKEAPNYVAVIVEDLLYLSTVLEEISLDRNQTSAVKFGLECCQGKIMLLNRIVEEIDPDFREDSRKDSRAARLWSKFKTAQNKAKIQEFRVSLSDTKFTLMLALVLQLQRPLVCISGGQIGGRDDIKSLNSHAVEQYKRPALIEGVLEQKRLTAPETQKTILDFLDKKAPNTKIRSEMPDHTLDMSVQSIHSSMENALKTAVEGFCQSGKFAQVMNSAMQRVIEVKSTYHGQYTDSTARYNINNSSSTGGQICRMGESDDKHYHSGHRISRTRICHSTTAMGTLFGKVWLRTSTLKVEDFAGAAKGKYEIITSFIFYPSEWLTRIGLRHGVEANLRTSTSGWRFDYSPVRAVPDNSLIFRLCREGELKAVQILLERGDASIRDTNSQGWTPLHFAAAEAHPDLCEFLIGAGADRTALAYEGPSDDALSPVTIFADTAQEVPAERKIQMLRLFTDCLELSEPISDGWTVIGALVRSYNKENVPLSSNSVNWLLKTLSTDGMVAFGPKTIWHGLQNAVRSFLVHEQNNKVLNRLLGLATGSNETPGTSRGASIAHWLALRASQRELLPMIIEAGTRLRMNGFDWVDDGAQVKEACIARQLPVIYAAWAKAMPGGIEKVDELITLELQTTLVKAGWTQETLRDSISDTALKAEPKPDSKCCSQCGDDYKSLRIGLVAPAWITFTECVKTKHRFNSGCAGIVRRAGVVDQTDLSNSIRPADHPQKDDSNGSEESGDGDDENNCGGEDARRKFDAYAAKIEKELGSPESDPFLASATLLYRAQGRVWLGSYKPGDRFCATCFLKGEEYISEGGLGTESMFSPRPATYVMLGLDSVEDN